MAMETSDDYFQKLLTKMPSHREPIRADAETQHIHPDVKSEGCDPILKSMKSQIISAHISQRDI
jgi:hypothetical protein